MARRRTKHLTEVELRIMKVLWERGECSVEAIQDGLESAGHPLAQPSIRTMLTILGKKKIVRRSPQGRRYLYSAAMEKDRAEREFVQDMVDRIFEGSPSQLVAAMLWGKDMERNERERLRQLLDEFDEEERA